MKKLLLPLAMLITVSSGAMAADHSSKNGTSTFGGCSFSCTGGGH